MMLAALLAGCLTMTNISPRAVNRVIDGDTFTLFAVGVSTEERVRLLGVDAAELHDSLGPAAKAYTTAWLSKGSFDLSTCKRDSFGRLLAVVYRGSDTLALDLIDEKLGVVYER